MSPHLSLVLIARRHNPLDHHHHHLLQIPTHPSAPHHSRSFQPPTPRSEIKICTIIPTDAQIKYIPQIKTKSYTKRSILDQYSTQSIQIGNMTRRIGGGRLSMSATSLGKHGGGVVLRWRSSASRSKVVVRVLRLVKFIHLSYTLLVGVGFS